MYVSVQPRLQNGAICAHLGAEDRTAYNLFIEDLNRFFAMTALNWSFRHVLMLSNFLNQHKTKKGRSVYGKNERVNVLNQGEDDEEVDFGFLLKFCEHLRR